MVSGEHNDVSSVTRGKTPKRTIQARTVTIEYIISRSTCSPLTRTPSEAPNRLCRSVHPLGQLMLELADALHSTLGQCQALPEALSSPKSIHACTTPHRLRLPERRKYSVRGPKTAFSCSCWALVRPHVLVGLRTCRESGTRSEIDSMVT